MQTNGTSPRRLVTISSCVLAVAFGIASLVYYVLGALYNPPGAYTFLGMALVHLITSMTFLFSARTRWRWLMLLVTIPCALEFMERVYEVSVW